jgi:DNA-binding HxlR family transcriptional regulator
VNAVSDSIGLLQALHIGESLLLRRSPTLEFCNGTSGIGLQYEICKSSSKGVKLVNNKNVSLMRQNEKAIISELMAGPKSFSMLQANLGVSTRTLQKRLDSLVQQWRIRRIDLGESGDYPRSAPRVWYQMMLHEKKELLTIVRDNKGHFKRGKTITYWGKRNALGRRLLDRNHGGHVIRPWPADDS